MTGIFEFALDVAAALGGGWFAEERHEQAARLRNLDGRRALFLYAQDYPFSARGRVRVTGEYPHRQEWRRRKVEVTVGIGRAPKAVARDLQRRLLPAYEAELGVALAAEVERQADEAGVERLAAEILAAVPGSVRSRVGVAEGEAQLSLRDHGYRHNVRVRSGSDGTVADIDLRGVTAAEAIRMLAALGQAEDDRGARPVAAPARRRLRLLSRWHAGKAAAA